MPAVVAGGWRRLFMNAVLPLVLGFVGMDHTTAARAVAVPEVMEHFLPEDELEGLLREFEKHCEKLDRLLTEADEIRNFGHFFWMMKQALMSVGSFSEGGADDEADFTSWPRMDPSRIMRVAARVPITLEMVRVVLAACVALGSEHAVVFDGVEGRCVVFSNGDLCREE